MDLILRVKRQYFEQINRGEKTEEYRLVKPYWDVRIVGRHFDQVRIVWGYPSKEDWLRTIIRPWNGYTLKTIVHPEFGPHPVRVYAINVSGKAHG